MSIRICFDIGGLIDQGSRMTWIYIPAGFATVGDIIAFVVERLGIQHDAHDVVAVMAKAVVLSDEPAAIFQNNDKVSLFLSSELHAAGRLFVSPTRQPRSNSKKRPRSALTPTLKNSKRMRISDRESTTSSSSSSDSSSSESDSDEEPHNSQAHSSTKDVASAAWKKTRRGKRAGRKHRKSTTKHADLAIPNANSNAIAAPPLPEPATTAPSRITTPAGEWQSVPSETHTLRALQHGTFVKFRYLRMTRFLTPEESPLITGQLDSISPDKSVLLIKTVAGLSDVGELNADGFLEVEVESVTELAKLIASEPYYTPTSPHVHHVPSSAPVDPIHLNNGAVTYSQPPAPTSDTKVPTNGTQAATKTNGKSRRETQAHVARRRMGLGGVLRMIAKPVE